MDTFEDPDESSTELDFSYPDGWEGYDHGQDEMRLTDDRWEALCQIVLGAVGSTDYLKNFRGRLEILVFEHAKTTPWLENLFFDKERPAFWARVDKASCELIDLLEDNPDKTASLLLLQATEKAVSEGEPGAFLKQLKLLNITAHRLSKPNKRTLKRLGRDKAYESFAEFWVNWLRCPVSTSDSSPLTKFVVELSKSLPWLSYHDRSPDNVRAFLRKWRTEQVRTDP